MTFETHTDAFMGGIRRNRVPMRLDETQSALRRSWSAFHTYMGGSTSFATGLFLAQNVSTFAE